MAVSIVPVLMAALHTQGATALPDVGVRYGYGVTSDPGDFLMIGVDDPFAEGQTSSASSAQRMATLATTRPRDEEGAVNCVAFSWNGDGSEAGQQAAVEAAFATFEAVASLLRADPTLGIGQPGRVVLQVGDVNLYMNQDTNGAEAMVAFTVANLARI